MAQPEWTAQAVFYHIYPLGFTDAPAENDFISDPVPRLAQIGFYIDHIASLGCNAVYFGPLFESASHGYDTVNYRKIDRRLGDKETFRKLVEKLHRQGIKVVIDGVFNHVSRQFSPFQDLIRNKSESPYREWFQNVDFSRDNPFKDGFCYDGWEGHLELVSLNLTNPDVREYLFSSIRWMIEDLEIDGFRLDVAYCLDPAFITSLSSYCRSLKKDLWLMGEMIHGDYRSIVRPDGLDAATNYECYKGLYSSLNDRNLFEIAWSLNRQFGEDGIYRGLNLYNFADNHDVDRISSNLNCRDHLIPLYALLFLMPGIPSVYYGSEWSCPGEKTGNDDNVLRPGITAIDKSDKRIAEQIALLSSIRKNSIAITHGDYRALFTASEQLLFEREKNGEILLIAINISEAEVLLKQEYHNRLQNYLDNREIIPRGESLYIPRNGWKIFKPIS